MNPLDNLYPQIIAKENLYQAAHRAARGKRYREATADFTFHLEDEVERLHHELATKTYRHGAYRTFTVHEPKARQVAAAPFRDRVVHHALHDVIEPMIDPAFIHDSYACRRGKGTHRAVERAQRFLRGNRYCFQGDVKKYFPSIDHRILKDLLRRRVRDGDVLWLLDEIIESAERLSRVADGESPQTPRDGQAAHTGLPIGNLTSQFFANLYLNELDYFVKFEMRAKGYLRYMDDFLLFDQDRARLAEAKARIRAFLNSRLALELHEGKSQIYKAGRGVTFLGFRIFQASRRLASGNVRRFTRRLRRFERRFERGEMEMAEIRDSLRCWAAHSRYANSAQLRKRVVQDACRRQAQVGELVRNVLSAEAHVGLSGGSALGIEHGHKIDGTAIRTCAVGDQREQLGDRAVDGFDPAVERPTMSVNGFQPPVRLAARLTHLVIEAVKAVSTGMLAALLVGQGVAFAQFTGGAYDGYASAVSVDTAIGGLPVSISSATDQVFMAGQASTAIAAITVTDTNGGAITALDATGDLRVRIPASFNMSWDALDTTATLSGSAASKLSPTVTFEDADKTARIDVLSDLAAGENVVISGLSFANFTAASAADNLGLDIHNAAYDYVTDDKSILIISTSDVLFAGGGWDGYDASNSGDQPLDTSLRLDGVRLDGLRVE